MTEKNPPIKTAIIDDHEAIRVGMAAAMAVTLLCCVLLVVIIQRSLFEKGNKA